LDFVICYILIDVSERCVRFQFQFLDFVICYILIDVSERCVVLLVG